MIAPKNKKTLVISSYAPPSIRGAPQMMYNLFKPLERESYCILTSFSKIDSRPIRNQNWLDGEYMFYDRPPGKEAPSRDREQPGKSDAPSGFFSWRKINRSGLAKILKYLTGASAIIRESILIFRAGKKTIESGKIGSIVAVSDLGPSLIAAHFLHRATNIPLRLLFFDTYKGNFFPFLGGILANVFEPKIIKHAEKIIVTNEGTRDLYLERYGDSTRGKISVVHNPAFPEKYASFGAAYKPNTPSVILYTGNIYWAQRRSLNNLIKAVNRANGLDVELRIYTASPVGRIEKSDKIRVSIAEPDKIPEIQSRADILFLPLSWNARSREIINTATPGKLTDYLIAGRPILIHAPASSFLAKYARENNFAHVVDEENIELLKEGIKRLLTDVNYANTLVENAKKTFFKNHNANDNSKKLRELLFC